MGDLTGDHVDVVPSIVRPERGDHGDADSPEPRAIHRLRSDGAIMSRCPFAEEERESHQSEDDRYLERRQSRLHETAEGDAPAVHQREDEDTPDGHDLTRLLREGQEVAEVDGEAGGEGGDRARLDHQKLRPAVEEAPERTIREAQIDILAADAGERRSQLRIGERAQEREASGENPHGEDHPRRLHLARDRIRDDEDARPDDRPHDDRARFHQAESALQLPVIRANAHRPPLRHYRRSSSITHPFALSSFTNASMSVGVTPSNSASAAQ
ncbi:hypothetical protein HRbin10_02197 [bacterium HR10]|nr:hypothetical protein HRbin10_02197 [bacterium HR10]